MAKARKPKPSPSPASRRWPRRAVAVALTLAVAAGVVVGVGRLGDESLARLAGRDRYAVRFADVECEVPPGLDRTTFLAEVRYAGDLPETFNALDPQARGRVAAALAAHPWVEAAEVTADTPGRAVAKVRFRTPVLAVKLTDGSVRLVDRHGVLLPAAPVPAGVGELVAPLGPPTVAVGRVWDDEVVRRAVELVGAYRPAKLEKTAAGWRLTTPDGKVLTVG